MNDFVSVKDRLPEPGLAVEVLRDYGYVVSNPEHPSFGCRFGVVRTIAYAPYVTPAIFECDVMDDGLTTHWRPAQAAPKLEFHSEIPDFLKTKSKKSIDV